MPGHDSSKLFRFAVPVLLAVITFAVYARTASFDFVNFDDPAYILENPHVRDGLTLDSFKAAWTSTAAGGNWHPLTWLSHSLDVQLFGHNPGPHHLVNVVLHVLNTLALYGLLTHMTGRVWPSAFVAGLFALHPQHVESVAWISERKDVLSTLFFLLTIWSYAWFVRRRSVGRYMLCMLLFALGLLSKGMIVTLPCVLLLLDVWPLRRWPSSVNVTENVARFRQLLIEKLPLFALAFVSSLVTFLAESSQGSVKSLEGLSLAGRLANAIVSYVRYLWIMIWPAELTIFYPHPITWPLALVVAAAIVLIFITAITLKFARTCPYLIIGWLFYLGTLVPVIGIIQVGEAALADRYTYIPMIGVFVMIAWSAADIVSRRRAMLWPVATLAIAAIVACSLVTFRQLSHWRDSITLFERALQVTDANYIAHNNLGHAYSQRGQPELAEHHYRQAVQLVPHDHTLHNNLGSALSQLGRHDQAIISFDESLGINPNFVEGRVNRAHSLLALNRMDDAVTELRRAIEIDSTAATAHNNLARILIERRQYPEAMTHLDQAIRHDPRYALAHQNRGLALMMLGSTDEAIISLHKALHLKPDLSNAHLYLGNIYAGRNQMREALMHYEQAVTGPEATIEARFNYASLLAATGNTAQAVQQYRTIAQTHVNVPTVQLQLGAALYRIDQPVDALTCFARAADLMPDAPEPLVWQAWILSTDPSAGVRDGARAVALATRAAALTQHRHANTLDALAAALAETGQFEQAIQVGEQALSLLESADRAAQAIAQRVQLYRLQQPYRQPPRP